MAWWDRWLGRTIDLNGESAPFWRSFFGTATNSGECVTYETALQLDAVWACISLIQNAVGTLPCNIIGTDGAPLDNSEPLYGLLHDLPNADDTAPEFWSMVALCLCLDGNFFAEKKMNGERLVALEPLNPLLVTVKRNARNARFYEYTDKGRVRTIVEGRMFHVRGMTLPGCDRGLSPIAVQREVIGNAQAGEKSAGRLYKGGLISTTFLMSDQTLKAEQRQQIGESLKAFAGADKAGGMLVLEAGLTPHSLNINPKDAQLLEARQYSVEQICRIFGVPPVMIGHAANGTTTWGSGIEQLILQFTKTCMRPMLKRIEYAIFRDILTPEQRKTLRAKFNMEELLRGDSAARAEFLTKMVNSGIYLPNEARAYEDKAPEAGGNSLIVNGTMTKLSTLGQDNAPAVPPKRAA